MLFRRLNWNIVGWFRIVSTVSYFVIAIGLAAMLYHASQAPGGFKFSHMLRLGLSFTGGTDITVAYDSPQSSAQIRNAITPLGIGDARINTVGKSGKRFIIETQKAYANDSTPLWAALGTVAPVDRAASQIASVGPSLGKEYLQSAIWALVIALSIQFLYIAFRFGWNYIFGLVTVIALVRDAAMMIGIYALADKRADDAFLAAVLTVIGYSVMDTIVILDRIRENTKLMAGKAYDYIVNESIKQTMTRSFNTLATVIITLVALLALGGASLKNFAFALLVGICSGGYHSIFYSAPLVLTFRKRQLAAAAKRRAEASALRAAGPRAAAEAAATGVTRGGQPREDIVAARRERRAKRKGTRPDSGAATPVRYKRKRDESSVALAEPDLHEYDDERVEEYDPLDAQNAGLDESALIQGHEEITLDLEAGERPAHE